MGAWTARWLRRGGHDVTLIDRHGPANRLMSSGDVSRITRSSHGPDRFYPVWQRRALGQWRELERGAGEQLFSPAGVVWLVSHGETFEDDSFASLTALGIPVERWSHDDFAARVPVMSADGVPWALFEPEAGALFARPAVGATIRAFEADGGAVVVGQVAPPDPSIEGSLDEVRLTDGRAIAADGFVFASGPWLPDLFPDLLGDLIEPHRQDVLEFAVPTGDGYAAGTMPVWIDFGDSFYGFPCFDGEGLKACPDWLGPVERPDASTREIDPASIEASRALLRKRFPNLAAQPVIRSRTCFYEVTPDAHFVIDRHPRLGNTWIAGGGTGHAFKHGPVIGEYLAALVTGDSVTASALGPPDARFALRAREAKAGFRTSGRNPLEDDAA